MTLPRSYLLFERGSSRPQLPRKGDRNDFSWTCILCLLMYVLVDFIDHSWLWYLFIHQVMDEVNRVLTQMRKFTEVCSISSSSLSLSLSSLAGQWHPPVFPLVSLWLPVPLVFFSGLNSVSLFTWGFLEYQHYFITFSLLCQQLDKLWWKPWSLKCLWVFWYLVQGFWYSVMLRFRIIDLKSQLFT